MSSNKKQLYRLYATRTINGQKSSYCGRLQYGVIPGGYKKDFNDFSEVYSEFGKRNAIFSYFCYEKRRLFSKAQIRVIEFWDDFGRAHFVTEKNFKNASLEIEYRANTINYSIQSLAKELIASDFFEYCRDNLQGVKEVD